MVLENMVDADSVDDELEAEVADECRKFGVVKSVTIASQRQNENSHEMPKSADDDGGVRIFVQFASQSGNLMLGAFGEFLNKVVRRMQHCFTSLRLTFDDDDVRLGFGLVATDISQSKCAAPVFLSTFSPFRLVVVFH